MIIIYSEVSKYIFALLMLIYTIQCFSIFGYKSEKIKNGIYLRQSIDMCLLNLLAFSIILINVPDMKIIIMYLMSQACTFGITCYYRLVYKNSNRLIINNMCMLLTISFIVLTRLSYDKALRQLFVVIFSFVITSLIPFIMSKFHNLRRFYIVFICLGIIFLLIVLLFSQAINGSKLSINIAGISFQLSEYVKILFVFGIAGILTYHRTFKGVIVSAIVAAAHVIILALSKDLGSAIIYFLVYFSMLYVSTHKIRYLLLGSAGGVIGALIGYKLFHHVRVRVKAFTDPFGTIDNEGYQIAQSLFAIGTGGFFGMGLYQGAPEKIPVVTSDFVFSAITEELGVVFSICLILVCCSCFIMFMNISMRFNDPFYKLVGVGLSITYGFQVFLTIGGVTKFIPLTGVTLPLVSYGGNSILVSLIMFSIIQGLYVTRKEYR